MSEPVLPHPAWLAGKGGRPFNALQERTLAWITRHRRTVPNYERLPAHHETYVYWAIIIVMTRRLARNPLPARSTPEPQAT